jgi:hypothetical protein
MVLSRVSRENKSENPFILTLRGSVKVNMGNIRINSEC